MHHGRREGEGGLYADGRPRTSYNKLRWDVVNLSPGHEKLSCFHDTVRADSPRWEGVDHLVHWSLNSPWDVPFFLFRLRLSPVFLPLLGQCSELHRPHYFWSCP